MCPGTGSGGEVTATGVPFYVGYTVMVIDAQLLNAGTPLLLRRTFLTTGVILVIIQIPELELRL